MSSSRNKFRESEVHWRRNIVRSHSPPVVNLRTAPPPEKTSQKFHGAAQNCLTSCGFEGYLNSRQIWITSLLTSALTSLAFLARRHDWYSRNGVPLVRISFLLFFERIVP